MSTGTPTVIHLMDPEQGISYCGEPITLLSEAGDTRPVCQACHRGAMKTVRSRTKRDALVDQLTAEFDLAVQRGKIRRGPTYLETRDHLVEAFVPFIRQREAQALRNAAKELERRANELYVQK